MCDVYADPAEDLYPEEAEAIASIIAKRSLDKMYPVQYEKNGDADKERTKCAPKDTHEVALCEACKLGVCSF